jgi:hypothetical protein
MDHSPSLRKLSGASYLDMMELFVIPKMQRDTEVTDILFQHNGASPRYHCRVTSTNKWVGPGGTTGWPPRSPDLTPLDFHFWGYVKDNVYVPLLPQCSRELRDRIRDAVISINEDMLRRVWDVCRITRIRNIEHL